jgi:hypothetical protein
MQIVHPVTLFSMKKKLHVCSLQTEIYVPYNKTHNPTPTNRYVHFKTVRLACSIAERVDGAFASCSKRNNQPASQPASQPTSQPASQAFQ